MIKEIPKTHLGWLGQRQLVHILKWERLADWQTGRRKKNCLQARKYQLDNIASLLLPPCYSIQFVRGLPLCAKQPDHQGIWFLSHMLKISAWILEDGMWYVFIKQKRVNISTFLYVSVQHLIKQFFLNCWRQVLNVWNTKKRNRSRSWFDLHFTLIDVCIFVLTTCKTLLKWQKNFSDSFQLKPPCFVLFTTARGFHSLPWALLSTVAYSLAKINECIDLVELNRMGFYSGPKPRSACPEHSAKQKSLA